MGQRGFSLIELLVSLSILAILALTASLGFGDIFRQAQDSKAVQVFQMDLKRAQAEAQAQGGRAIVSTDPDNQGYSVGIDLLPYSSPAVADTVLLTRELPSGIFLTLGGTVIFDPKGMVIDLNGDLTTVILNFSRATGTFLAGTINQVGVFS